MTTATIDTGKVLECDGGFDTCTGAGTVSMIGNKGYAYCAACGLVRRQSGYERVRKLTPKELRTLESGEPLKRY